MRALRRLILAALIMGLLCGCGDDPQSKSNNGNNANNGNNLNNVLNNANNASGEDLASLLKDTACEAAFDCTSPFLTPILGRYDSVNACKNDNASGLFGDVDLAELDTAIEAGRISLDTSNLNTCIAQLRTGFCAGTIEVESPECESIVQGNVEEGGNCASSQECANDLDCRINFEDEQCYGTCQPNCGEENCSSSEYCDGSTCVARKAADEPCSGFGDCAQGLYCRDDRCTAGGDSQAGEECERAEDCAEGLSCFGEVCITVNSGSTGESCDFVFGAPQQPSLTICRAGNVCTNLMIEGNAASGTCAEPKIEGAECLLFSECGIGLTCDSTSPGETGNCVPVYAAGEPCTVDFDCQSNDCSGGMCAAPSQTETCVVP